MGIQGLLPLLKSIHNQSHLDKWSGHTLAVDGYVWLHRGAYACAQELCLGSQTTKHVDYFMNKIKQLIHHRIKPYVVFDGDRLPNKKLTESDRANRREAALERANRFLKSGQRDRAREEFVKATDVTPKMAHDVIQALRAIDVKYVVAPYEADAQLRYLEITGQVTGIITEDSDLLVYGAKNVLFKLDNNGSCVHICRDHFGLVKELRMSLWTDRQFRQMAILSGCDYLPSIPGLGIKKAYDLIRRFSTAERAIKATRLEGKLNVPIKYEKLFQEAEFTFLHQTVYDPVTRSLVPLHPLPDPPPSPDLLLGCGERWEEAIALGVAEGRLDPMTKQEFRSTNLQSEERPKKFAFTSQPKFNGLSKQKKTKLIPESQATLKNFVLKSTGSTAMKCDEISSAKSILSITTERGGTCNNSPTKPKLLSQYFETNEEQGHSKEPVIADVLDGLVAEDVTPLSQESWEAMTEISTQEIEYVHKAFGANQNDNSDEDLPTSQMEDQSEVHQSGNNNQFIQYPGSSFQTNSCASSPKNPTSSASPTIATSGSLYISTKEDIPKVLLEKVNNLNSDDPISSDSEFTPQLLSKPRVTLITHTPFTSDFSGKIPKRRATEPIPRVIREDLISSDPIEGSDDYQHTTADSIPRPNKDYISEITSGPYIKKRRKGGFFETPTPKNLYGRGACLEEDEPLTPSLARIASGIRSRFTYKPNCNSYKPRNVESKSPLNRKDDNTQNRYFSKDRQNKMKSDPLSGKRHEEQEGGQNDLFENLKEEGQVEPITPQQRKMDEDDGNGEEELEMISSSARKRDRESPRVGEECGVYEDL
ncbi:hypothetical protein BY996DRAFT_6408533 [Phakopsora pachyrhizi]|nr:hypothetical protein BY996DRAFT_6408533 [Phakopsora pachyrhizi]